MNKESLDINDFLKLNRNIYKPPNPLDTLNQDLYLLDRFQKKGNKGYNPIDRQYHFETSYCHKCKNPTTLRDLDDKPICQSCINKQKENYYTQQEIQEYQEKIESKKRDIGYCYDAIQIHNTDMHNDPNNSEQYKNYIECNEQDIKNYEQDIEDYKNQIRKLKDQLH